MPESDYEPEVDDYVIWERKTWVGITTDQGWVYFKAPTMEDKKGFAHHPRYITIETGVKPRPDAEVEGSLHQHIHTLLLCQNQFWHQLKYVKSRTHAKPQHYSECEN